jgi:hypothetical protein
MLSSNPRTSGVRVLFRNLTCQARVATFILERRRAGGKRSKIAILGKQQQGDGAVATGDVDRTAQGTRGSPLRHLSLPSRATSARNHNHKPLAWPPPLLCLCGRPPNTATRQQLHTAAMRGVHGACAAGPRTRCHGWRLAGSRR